MREVSAKLTEGENYPSVSLTLDSSPDKGSPLSIKNTGLIFSPVFLSL